MKNINFKNIVTIAEEYTNCFGIRDIDVVFEAVVCLIDYIHATEGGDEESIKDLMILENAYENHINERRNDAAYAFAGEGVWENYNTVYTTER